MVCISTVFTFKNKGSSLILSHIQSVLKFPQFLHLLGYLTEYWPLCEKLHRCCDFHFLLANCWARWTAVLDHLIQLALSVFRLSLSLRMYPRHDPNSKPGMFSMVPPCGQTSALDCTISPMSQSGSLFSFWSSGHCFWRLAVACRVNLPLQMPRLPLWASLLSHTLAL